MRAAESLDRPTFHRRPPPLLRLAGLLALALAPLGAAPLRAEIAVTVDDGVSTVAAGDALTYQIAVSFSGTILAEVRVIDDFPPELACSWTCSPSGSCASASGTGDIDMEVVIATGSSVQLAATCTVAADTPPGQLTNTATIACAGGFCTDSNAANNSATDVDAIVRQSDLGVTITDGATSVVAGSHVTYEIEVANDGPSDAPGASVSQTLSGLEGCAWTCSAPVGASCTPAGAGAIADTFDVPAGSTVEYLASCVVSPSATGTVVSTVEVAPPADATDPVAANDTATDADLVQRQADLSLVMTDGVTSATPGESTTYSIVVLNTGPSDADARVSDAFGPALSCAWTCTGGAGATCPASGTGSIDEIVHLPLGGGVTFAATCDIASSALGTLANAASVTPLAGTVDPDLSDNFAIDVDSLVRTADLRITKTDGAVTATAGAPVTYTIVARNDGPSDATGVVVLDAFPEALEDCAWTCQGSLGGTCSAVGVGDLDDTGVALPAGASVTYSATCTVAPDAFSTISNSATVTAPLSIVDPSTNNFAIDLDFVIREADLAITKDDGVAFAAPGGSVTYSLTASNAGPSDVSSAWVRDFPPQALTCEWTCAGASGGTCPASGSSGSQWIDAFVGLPAGGSITFTLECAVAADATGLLVNTATVSPPAGVTDPVPGNDSATDIDTHDPQIFASGFETGDLSEWGGHAPAALGAALGAARVPVAGAVGARFVYDLGALPPGDLRASRIATVVDAAGRTRYVVQARRVGEGASVELRLVAHTWSGVVASAWLAVEERPEILRLRWWAAGSQDAAGGGVALALGERWALALEDLPAMPDEPAELRVLRVRERGRGERR